MNSKYISNYLDLLIPNPACELNYNKDYELLLAVMLSAQSRDERVNKVTKVLFSKYDNLVKLKQAEIKDIENIIKELGNYHKKAKAIIDIAKIIDEDYKGIIPKKRTILESLPMVGRKTTSVVLSELYNMPNIAVDTHVERVSKRLGIAKEKDNVLIVENKLKKFFPKDKWNRIHHQFVLFGRYYCTSRKPKCDTCEFKNICKKNKEEVLLLLF